MHGHSSNSYKNSFSTDYLAMSGSVTPLLPPHAATNDFISLPHLAIPTYELDSACATSRGYDSPIYKVCQTKEIQRSGSCHSITTQLYHKGCAKQPVVSSPSELLNSEGSGSTILRRVFSAGDVQGTNMTRSHFHRSESPLSSESNNIIESINKVCRYSPDERKERIERYLSKKTQRNFTKKIKYVCRKTLADSRPRIRGRFARNDEIITMDHQCTSQGIGEVIDDNWMNSFLDSFPPDFIP